MDRRGYWREINISSYGTQTPRDLAADVISAPFCFVLTSGVLLLELSHKTVSHGDVLKLTLPCEWSNQTTGLDLSDSPDSWPRDSSVKSRASPYAKAACFRLGGRYAPGLQVGGIPSHGASKPSGFVASVSQQTRRRNQRSQQLPPVVCAKCPELFDQSWQCCDVPRFTYMCVRFWRTVHPSREVFESLRFRPHFPPSNRQIWSQNLVFTREI